MKAFKLNRYGKKETLQLSEFAEPVTGESEVLVEIHAAGVNALDSFIKKGDFKAFLPYKMPLILGHDVAGVVKKIGAKVSNFKPGDEVFARVADHRIGTFAEYVAVDEADLARKPRNVSMTEAASIPLVGLTSFQALIESANLKKGQKVFIQAGSGGVGTFAIQLAKHLGALVATTTSRDNFDLVKRLGADVVIDYKTEDFESVLKDYDVVLHSNRDSAILKKSLRILKPGGKLISLVGPPTPEFASALKLPWYLKFVMWLLSFGVKSAAKRFDTEYSFLFMRANGKQLGEITSLIESGIVKPVIDKVFPFDKTNDAMAYVDKGRAKGKVVVRMI